MPNPVRIVMSSFKGLPLRQRLSRLIAVCAGLCASLCMLAVVGTGGWLQQGSARSETTEVARTLSFALQAPVAFDDRKGIQDALTLLRARPQVSGAWVYDSQGRLLAAYGTGDPVPPDAASGGVAWRYLQATEAIVAHGQTVGRVVIVNQLSHLWQALGIALLAIALGSLGGFGLSVLLAQRIARNIARPIDRLAQASRAIAQDLDQAPRLPRGVGDEIGTAVDAFNAMLDEIRSRGVALRDANRELERRVADRTLALQNEKERAEAASIAKTRFLANMSHELRTPLNAVIGAAQLLQDGGGDTDGQAHLVAAIRSSGTNLLHLIDNILDLSRIETGALELSPEDFNLIDCIEAAVSTVAVSARLKGLEMAFVISPALAAWRHGDPLRLRQVLLNLLGNAVKFTLQGEVVLRVEPGTGDDGLQISVSDSGIGIGEASLKQVFEPFRQADDASNRRFGGSGLGLAIARQLVEAMGGCIGLRSQLGSGTRFDIELALPPAKVPLAEAPPLGHHIAYFEPHEPSAQALQAQLQRLGCHAERCQTPQQLQRWMHDHAGVPGKPWLLAAVDADDTWDFLEASIDCIDPERVIGMAASESHAADAAREHFQVPRNVIKPVLRSALVSRLGAVARPAPAAAASRPSGVMTNDEMARLKHVLVVEDDPVNQMIVCRMLHSAGYLTSSAEDGAQALRLLGKSAFDLVLMDWQMPDMDGLEVTRRLRAGAVGRFGKVVPIVALTANAFAEDRAACLAAGMNDFLTKPVLASSLEALVGRWVAGHGDYVNPSSPSFFAPLV